MCNIKNPALNTSGSNIYSQLYLMVKKTSVSISNPCNDKGLFWEK